MFSMIFATPSMAVPATQATLFLLANKRDSAADRRERAAAGWSCRM